LDQKSRINHNRAFLSHSIKRGILDCGLVNFHTPTQLLTSVKIQSLKLSTMIFDIIFYLKFINLIITKLSRIQDINISHLIVTNFCRHSIKDSILFSKCYEDYIVATLYFIKNIYIYIYNIYKLVILQ